MEKTINSDTLFWVFPFLELSHLALCQRVCRQWNEILKKAACWKSISDKSEKIPVHHKSFQIWLINKIKTYKPTKLTIYDSENLWSVANILQIFSERNENLKKLQLFFEIEEESVSNELIEKIICNCPNLQSFKTCGKFLSDENMIYFKELNYLTVFVIFNDDSNFQGTHLKILRPLNKIFLRPHNIEYESLAPLIQNSQTTLKKIGFDCEILEEKQLLSIIEKVNPEIESLLLTFCEKFQDQVLNSILKFKKLKKFKFSKGNSLNSGVFSSFFKEMNCENLIFLSLSECSELNDESVSLIAKKAKNLKKLDLSWCIELNSFVISEIFRNCPFLEKISLTGIKKLNADAFPIINELINVFEKEAFLLDRKNKTIDLRNVEKYFKSAISNLRNEIPYYKYLKFVNVRSCDFVADEVLFILKILYPYQKLINYYGEEVVN